MIRREWRAFPSKCSEISIFEVQFLYSTYTETSAMPVCHTKMEISLLNLDIFRMSVRILIIEIHVLQLKHKASFPKLERWYYQQ